MYDENSIWPACIVDYTFVSVGKWLPRDCTALLSEIMFQLAAHEKCRPF